MTKNAPLMSGPSHRLMHGLIFLAILSATLLTVFPDRPASAASQAKKSQDTIFLIDASSSMLDIFDDVKGAILDYVRESQPGDNVVLISFGKGVTLRVRQKISSKKDIKAIEFDLASLNPDEYYSNISGALEKGMEELRRLERKNPDHVRTVVLMSDGKNNPPDDIAQPLTFQELLEKYPNLARYSDLGFFYLSFGEDPDPEVMSFIEEVEGMSFDLGKDSVDLTDTEQELTFAQVFVEPVSLDLGRIVGPEASVPVSLAFFPSRGNPSGRSINVSMSAQFKGNPSWKTTVEVRPRGVICSGKPWTEDFTFNVDSFEEGTIVGTLQLQPEKGQVLFIEPSEIPITMTISQPFVTVAIEELLDFGPINPLFTFEETKSVPLFPNPAARKELLQATCDIVVPEGMTITTDVGTNEGLQEIIVTVMTDESFEPDHSMTLEGTVDLSGAKHAVNFSESSIEMRITVSPSTMESRSISEAISSFFSKYGRLIIYSVIAILLVAVIVAGAYYWIRLRPRSALEGKLILINLRGKKQSKFKATAINLHSVGKSVGGDSVILGSAKDASITLPHKSVSGHHVEIYAKMDKGSKRIVAEPVGKNFVIINLEKLAEATPLSDKDLIEIGAYTFRFENAHPYKQIVVRFLDGRIEKGTPATWDIESDGFGLLPRDALPGSTEEIFVSFCDLKAVYFVRDFDGQIGRKMESPETQIRGIHMKLTFYDGEQVDGFTAQTYDPVSERFYFFPSDQTGNTISMVVERANLENLEIMSPPGAEGFQATGDMEPI